MNRPSFWEGRFLSVVQDAPIAQVGYLRDWMAFGEGQLGVCQPDR
jgi:hypothetical protein